MAGLHFIVKKISSLQNSPREMLVFKETWQFKITPLADVMEMWSPFWGVFCFSICFSHLCKRFVVCFIPDGCRKLIGFAKGANFWFILVLSISGAPDYVDQLHVAAGLMPRTAQSPPKDGLVWFGNDLLFKLRLGGGRTQPIGIIC